MIQDLKGYCSKIIQLLSASEYCIDDEHLRRIQAILQDAIIHKTTSSSEKITVPLFDLSDNCCFSVETINLSQVIDAPPLIRNKQIYPIKPTLVLCDTKNDLWTCTHELCHLLSIGSYAQKNKTEIHHCFGINEYTYSIQDDHLIVKNREIKNDLNELIVDYITWHLLEAFSGDSIIVPYRGIEIFDIYVKKECSKLMTAEQFVGLYFSNKTKQLKGFLSGFHCFV